MEKGYIFVTINEKIKVGVKKGAPIIFHAIFTQEYIPDVDMGHWKGVIFDESGNIINTTSTCCAPPKGKIDYALVAKEAKDYYRENRKFKFRNFSR